jgi:hypothetical protein
MARLQARAKPEHRHRYPELKLEVWYDVVPLWPGLRERMTTLAGDRLTRLRIGRTEFVTVRAEHLDFRPTPGTGSGASQG